MTAEHIRRTYEIDDGHEAMDITASDLSDAIRQVCELRPGCHEVRVSEVDVSEHGELHGPTHWVSTK